MKNILLPTATIIYVALLAVVTHIPQSHMPSELDTFGLDKILHAAAYAILTALLLCTLARRPSLASRTVLFVLILVLAAVDEYTQVLVGRTASVFDWTADVVGSTMVFVVVMKAKPRL